MMVRSAARAGRTKKAASIKQRIPRFNLHLTTTFDVFARVASIRDLYYRDLQGTTRRLLYGGIQAMKICFHFFMTAVLLFGLAGEARSAAVPAAQERAEAAKERAEAAQKRAEERKMKAQAAKERQEQAEQATKKRQTQAAVLRVISTAVSAMPKKESGVKAAQSAAPGKTVKNTASKAESDAAYEAALRENLMIREMEMNQRAQIDAKSRANRQAANNAYIASIKTTPAQKSQIGNSSSSKSAAASRPMCARSDCRAPARDSSAYCEIHKDSMGSKQYCSRGTCKNKPAAGSVFCALHK
jgi:hypothetical protein